MWGRVWENDPATSVDAPPLLGVFRAWGKKNKQNQTKKESQVRQWKRTDAKG